MKRFVLAVIVAISLPTFVAASAVPAAPGVVPSAPGDEILMSTPEECEEEFQECLLYECQYDPGNCEKTCNEFWAECVGEA